MWPFLARGDWVRTTTLIHTTVADHALGTGIRRGTTGVVCSRAGSRVEVNLDMGARTVTVTLPARVLQLTRRGGGHDRFNSRVRLRLVVRLALALWLLWPLAYSAAAYVWTAHTADGLLEAVVVGGLDSLGEWIGMLVKHPLRTLIYTAFLTVLSKIAFGR